MTIWIATGGRLSNGAAVLAKEPGFKRLRQGKKFKLGDTVINWGSSVKLEFNNWVAFPLINHPTSVKTAACKLSTLQMMQAAKVQSVEWTKDQAVAQTWSNDGKTVVCRTKLTGHSGDGIIIVEPHQQVPVAPLYTKYVFKVKEYRVHVVKDKIIDTQRKIRDPEREPADWKVRSHANGFIFARNGVLVDNARDQLAVAAVSALGLDFGAVDIVEDKNGSLYVLEVNTAPGLEGQTVTSYAEAFRNVAAA